MGKIQKRTKKFIKNNLERTKKERRLKQKFARKDASKLEKKPRKEKTNDDEEDAPKKKIEELNVDEFLEGKFFAQEDSSDDDAAIDEVDEGDEEELLGGGEEGDGDDDDDDDMDGMDEASFHKMQLENLKKSDPEFYAHLEQHDKGLLDFKIADDDAEEGAPAVKEKPKSILDVIGRKKTPATTAPKAKTKAQQQAEQEELDEGEGDEEMWEDEGDAGEESDEEEADLKKKKPSQSAKRKKKIASVATLTLPQLKKWKSQLKAHSKPALKMMLRAFRAAAHISDDAKEGEAEQLDMTFANSRVFNSVIQASFQLIPADFAYRLGTEHEGSLKSNPNWPQVEPLIRSYLGNLVHFVSRVLDVTMIRLILKHLEVMMPYFEPFPKMALKFLKGLLTFWSTSEEDVRIDAFLRIRQLALTQSEKSQILESALKGIYLTFVRNASFASKETMPTLNFMANCVVELYSLEPVSSYQHGFVYIRQLAIHLRNAIHAKTKEAYKGVYNWKYVSCLRVWALLLATHGTKPDSYLRPLVYPLVQVCLGVLDLLPSARYFPLRFNVIRILNKLAEATDTYIPLSSYLMDATHTALQLKKPKKGMGSPPNFLYILKVTKATAASKNYQTAVLAEALNLLLQHLATYASSVAFPELAVPIQFFLRREKKNCSIARLKKPIAQFLVKLDTNAKYITAQRAAIDYTPQDAVNTAKKSFKQLLLDKDKNAIAPLEKFAKLQADSDAEGRLLSAQEMQNESRSRKKEEAEEDEDDEEEDEEEEGVLEGEEGDEGEEAEGDEEEAEEKAAIANELKKRKREANVAKVMGRADEPADEVEDFVLSDSEDEGIPFAKKKAKAKGDANKPEAKGAKPAKQANKPNNKQPNQPVPAQQKQKQQQPNKQNGQPSPKPNKPNQSPAAKPQQQKQNQQKPQQNQQKQQKPQQNQQQQPPKQHNKQNGKPQSHKKPAGL